MKVIILLCCITALVNAAVINRNTTTTEDSNMEDSETEQNPTIVKVADIAFDDDDDLEDLKFAAQTYDANYNNNGGGGWNPSWGNWHNQYPWFNNWGGNSNNNGNGYNAYWKFPWDQLSNYGPQWTSNTGGNRYPQNGFQQNG